MSLRSVLSMVLALALTPAFAADKPLAGVVARMGEVELRADELRAILESLPPEAKVQLATAPQELARIIRLEVLRRSLAAEARGKGWDKRPEVVSQMERAREQMLVATYMNNVARPPEGFPSDAEVKAAYDQNAASFAVPKQYRLSQLFVLTPADADKAMVTKAQAKAADLATKAKAKGADFGALAKTASEHADSAAKGGDMGWVAENALIPELREPVSRMAKGEIAGPIRSPQGWHVVRLDDVREKSMRPLAEVRDQIAAAMRMRKAQETEQAYLTFMTNKTPVNINEAELAKLQTAPR